jgi:predicted O-methyltransferase YrrM
MEYRTAHNLVDWQGYLYHDEVDLLHRLAARIKKTTHHGSDDPVFVNIGAGAGTSTIALLEGNADAIVYSVDIRADESPEYTNEHLRLPEANPTIARRVIRIWGDSRKVGRVWPFGADLIFVDGGHDYEEVKADIEAWYDKIWVGGIIAFHDYGFKETDGSEQWPGVRRAVDEFAGWAHPKLIEQVGMIRAFEV